MGRGIAAAGPGDVVSIPGCYHARAGLWYNVSTYTCVRGAGGSERVVGSLRRQVAGRGVMAA